MKIRKVSFVWQFALWMTVAVFLVGCQGKDNNSAYKVIVADPIIMTHSVLDSGMDMAVNGTLYYNEANKCMYITEESSGNILFPVWPKGTVPVMEDNQYGVNTKALGIILEGESVQLGGGGIEETEIANAGLPSECLVEVDQIVKINAE